MKLRKWQPLIPAKYLEQIMSNLDLWDKVKKTNPKYTKPAKIGGMKITAIAPQYQIMLATEQFGPYGQGFGFKSIELDYSLVAEFKMIVFKGVFFHPGGEFPIINSSKLYMDRGQTMLDADFAKKIETDALTKALSKLGFNADVFMGAFDDHRYVSALKEEFNPPAKVNIKNVPIELDIAAVASECGWTNAQVCDSFNPPLNSISEIQDKSACAEFLRANKI